MFNKYGSSAHIHPIRGDILISINRLSSLPLYEQIVEQVSTAIRQSRLVRGTRLPSIRQLADKLGVSPFTTVTAYDQLMAMGLIVSRPASGFFVADFPLSVSNTHPPSMIGVEGNLDALWLTRSVHEAGPEWITAGSDVLPACWMQDIAPESLVQKALRNRGDEFFRPVPAQGSFAMRETLSAYLMGCNIIASTDNILLTDGATQALDLICATLLKAGDTVVAAVPGSPMLFSRLSEHGVYIVPVPRRPDGLDVSALEALCKVRPPKMVFTQSVLHDPTGWSSSISNLHRLLTLAESYDFMIAEDDVYGDFAYGSPARLAQLSALRHVLYYSSFAKSMGPFTRLGFIAAESHWINDLLNTKMRAASRGSCLDEWIVLELLRSRYYRKGVEQLKLRLEQVRASVLALLSGIGIHFDDPGNGIFLWGRVAYRMNMDLLVRDAYGSRILLAHGALFQPKATAVNGLSAKSPYLRFNVAQSCDARLRKYLEEQFMAIRENSDG